MKKFALPASDYTLSKRLSSELSLLLLLIAILLIFVGINVVYITATLLMYILMLLLKRNRIVYQIEFSDSNADIKISYFYLIVFKGEEKIAYSKLNYELSLKRFGFGSAIETLELMNGKILVAEIRKEGKWKWSENNISILIEILKAIKAKN